MYFYHLFYCFFYSSNNSSTKLCFVPGFCQSIDFELEVIICRSTNSSNFPRNNKLFPHELQEKPFICHRLFCSPTIFPSCFTNHVSQTFSFVYLSTNDNVNRPETQRKKSMEKKISAAQNRILINFLFFLFVCIFFIIFAASHLLENDIVFIISNMVRGK